MEPRRPATSSSAAGGDWVKEVFPTAELARLPRLLPVGSARRRLAKAAAGRLLDTALDARQALSRTSRDLDRAAADVPSRQVLVLGVYRPDGVDDMTAAVASITASPHVVRFALGTTGSAPSSLALQTLSQDMTGGKYANLNRLSEAAAPHDDDWMLILDDDVTLPPRFLDRMIGVAERVGLDLGQPAQTWGSDAAWRVTRRRRGVLRETRFVESGPVTLLRRGVFEAVTPFSEEGMGWGICLHWGALARERGWRLGIVDALPVRHGRRPTASTYAEADALDAARRFLADHEHIGFDEANEVLSRHRALPSDQT